MNCRETEVQVLRKPDVQKVLEEFVVAKLYTDKQAEPMISNKKLQVDRFGTTTLPLYVFFDRQGNQVEVIAKSFPFVQKEDFLAAFEKASGGE